MGGGFSLTGTFTKQDSGTATISGPESFSSGTTLAINGGVVKFNVSSGPVTVGSGVTATVASGAQLELAGSVAALAAGSGRVNVVNSSAAPGVLVSGTNQQVGVIDGSGTTSINAGSDLTANHVIQTALSIGGTAASAGVLTIAPSDASGGPLDVPSGFALTSSLEPSEPFAPGSLSSSNLLTSNGSSISGLTLGADTLEGSNLGGSSAVPEPTSLLLSLFGLASLSCLTRRKRM